MIQLNRNCTNFLGGQINNEEKKIQCFNKPAVTFGRFCLFHPPAPVSWINLDVSKAAPKKQLQSITVLPLQQVESKLFLCPLAFPRLCHCAVSLPNRSLRKVNIIHAPEWSEKLFLSTKIVFYSRTRTAKLLSSSHRGPSASRRQTIGWGRYRTGSCCVLDRIYS